MGEVDEITLGPTSPASPASRSNIESISTTATDLPDDLDEAAQARPGDTRNCRPSTGRPIVNDNYGDVFGVYLRLHRPRLLR
jgi:hypothetical protein